MDQDIGDIGRRNVRFFRVLAIFLGAGIVVSLILTLGIGGIDIRGIFDLQALSRGLLLMVFIIAVVLAMFLLRIGVIFDVEKQVGQMFTNESERLAKMRAQELADAREFRDQLRRDLAELRDGIRREFNERDGKFDNAILAANKAMKMAQDAMDRANALAKEPAYRSTIEQLVKDVAQIAKDVTALRTADKVNSPLLKDLQERVVLLEQGHKKLNHRVDETLEVIERRDMEAAATRQTLDHELAGLKKRETLLLVKQKELESANVNLVTSQKVVPAAFAPGEEKHHVLTIEGIGPVYASRLNAAGVITIPQLIAADPEQLGPRIDAMPNLVGEWQAMAQIMRLKGIGPQSAEVLVKAGVTSVKQLASQDPDELSVKIRELEKGRKIRIQGLDVSPGVAKRWVDAAKNGSYDAN